ncbi:putative metalloprotease CJM1_0395 family protein [Solibacillus sp. FSL H8-0538]|uniref:putative metalloprotease CJM1_0395 family protein n=1 Tax=Solibacillus sp. FSL H8-0538 TaxID=2921400 RepID=UPI0030FC79C6
MKIASLIHHVGADFEDRKRALQRKEMGEAYKKNAKYVDANKNPMLKALENLLSGKTEKDLHAADIEAKEQSAQELAGNDKQQQLELLEVKKEIQLLKQTEQNVIAHEQAHKAAGGGVTGAISYSHTTGPDEQRYIVAGEVSIDVPSRSTTDETIAILEKVKQAALAPAQPSPQDLRVAASAAAQILQTKSELSGELVEQLEEVEPFVDESLQVSIPERFQNEFQRNAQEETIFGKDLESLLFKRTFNKAIAKYATHIEMVKNGYRMFDEPKFSQTA